MDDREFFDVLFQTWAQTTGSENMFWKVEKAQVDAFDSFWEVYAVDSDKEEHFIGSFLTEEDADFVAGVHGCIPDLVRQLHAALDEADRLDREMDEVQNQLMEAELRVMELKEEAGNV